ncbi:type VI secretion system-associated FHA domain protein TagH [Allosphingosinicella deserti]|uniref:Type VI secretion system-associated FHA domain protein TagH n=1 Tax=Allosphingosinicella deserti TaxID=2116704 RepID=A0A2P7QFT9_9SPHN|nr:type VI secretion system-associated FHA domain protein TagH [Sphingomonas deserti]PSJ36833.1 type VI secretion system-associated FHA domain protein TagH [Sphingomonas deserti]
MTLRFRIEKVTLGSGEAAPADLVLDRQGALIGRSPNADWTLPDPRNHISSRHCEVRYQNGAYLLNDISMNGTFVNGRPDRLTRPHRIADGDVITIGHFEIRASLLAEAPHGTATPGPQSQWDGWAPAGPHAATPSGWDPPPAIPAPARGWDAPPSPPSQQSGWGAPSGPARSGSNDSWAPAAGAGAATPGRGDSGSNWTPPPTPPASPVASAWHVPEAPQQDASQWSSAAPDRPPAAAPDDIWGRLAEGNVVDWARGGFGQPIAPRQDLLGVDPRSPEEALGVAPSRSFGAADPWTNAAPTPIGAPVSDVHFAMPKSSPAGPAGAGPAPAFPDPAHTPTIAPAPLPPVTPAVPDGALVEALLRAAGVERSVVRRDPALLERAGQLFHRLVAGLVLMVEARARAKSQMGAESTAFEVAGNNPIKFARSPEDAVAALLNPPAQGFMDAGQAIEEAYYDLQSHQVATLRAMQGALRATLERFSPGAIRERAESRGLLAKILPAARDAALWQAYEREFSGVARGSDEAFMDVFAKEFRKAYDEQSRMQKRDRR